MNDQGDLFGKGGGGGRDGRDDGMGRAIRGAGNWWTMAVRYVHTVPNGWEGKGEDLFRLIIRVIGPPPHSNNVMGALVHHCMTRGWLVKTGRRAHMTKDTSNHRLTDILRRTGVR